MSSKEIFALYGEKGEGDSHTRFVVCGSFDEERINEEKKTLEEKWEKILEAKKFLEKEFTFENFIMNEMNITSKDFFEKRVKSMKHFTELGELTSKFSKIVEGKFNEKLKQVGIEEELDFWVDEDDENNSYIQIELETFSIRKIPVIY